LAKIPFFYFQTKPFSKFFQQKNTNHTEIRKNIVVFFNFLLILGTLVNSHPSPKSPSVYQTIPAKA